MEKFCRLMGRPVMTIGKSALDALERYRWPGNVRELENLVERLTALTEHDLIAVDDLPGEMVEALQPQQGICLELSPDGIDLPGALEELERKLIVKALQMSGNVKARAAILLGLNRTTLVEKMKRLGIS
jgi:DNA-binding NtrC family response regulator